MKSVRLLAVALLSSLLLGGCAAQKGEGFALYLPAREVPPSQVPVMSHLELAERPLISGDDIASYSWATHTIELTAGAHDRLRELEVPVAGRVFVVAVDRQTVYWGAFWTPLSSMSFDGVVILTPSPQEAHTVRLQLGYPSRLHFAGEDPRSSPIVRQALEQAGKLK